MKRLVTAALVILGFLLVPAVASARSVDFTTTALDLGAVSPSDVAVGDLDGKNGPDIVTSLYVPDGDPGEILISLNKGDGTFAAPQTYMPGCPVDQIELADLGGTNNSDTLDGKLDAAILCSTAGGDYKYLGRLPGNGSGGFGTPQLVSALNLGAFGGGSTDPQGRFGLAKLRASGLPPVPAFIYLYDAGSNYSSYLCLGYSFHPNPPADQTKCLTPPDVPEVGPPVATGTVADARIFASTAGSTGKFGVAAFGDFPGTGTGVADAEVNDYGPLESSTDVTQGSIVVGDLEGDGNDIIAANGNYGLNSASDPAAGQVSIRYGTSSGIPTNEQATTFQSAPGVSSIALGDFDRDGHQDVIGNSHNYSFSTNQETNALFVQSGNGSGGLGSPQMIPIDHSSYFTQAPVRVADLDGNHADDAVAIAGNKVQVLLNDSLAGPPVNPLGGIKGLPASTTASSSGKLILGTATNPPTSIADLTVTIPKHGRIAARPLSRSKSTVIAHAKIKVPAGKKKSLDVKLKSSARSKLKHGTLHAKLAIVAIAADGTKKTKTTSLKIKPPKKHR